MRKADKIEKYALKLAGMYGRDVIESDKSRYFNVQGRILRTSDHIGSCSSGTVSIIIPEFSEKDEYIIHAHTSGSITIASYEQTKEVVRSFFFVSSIFNEIVQQNYTFEMDKRDKFNKDAECQRYKAELERLKDIEAKYTKLKSMTKCKTDTETIMGLPLDVFSEGQLKSVTMMVDSIMRNIEK